jgi:large subunit ribosomal protein L30e
MDLDRGIRVAVDTGNVTLGSSKSIQGLKLGRGKLVIIASNCPEEVEDDVMYY